MNRTRSINEVAYWYNPDTGELSDAVTDEDVAAAWAQGLAPAKDGLTQLVEHPAVLQARAMADGLERLVSAQRERIKELEERAANALARERREWRTLVDNMLAAAIRHTFGDGYDKKDESPVEELDRRLSEWNRRICGERDALKERIKKIDQQLLDIIEECPVKGLDRLQRASALDVVREQIKSVRWLEDRVRELEASAEMLHAEAIRGRKA